MGSSVVLETKTSGSDTNQRSDLMLRKVMTSLLLILGTWASQPIEADAQDVSPRNRPVPPDNAYIVYENPNNPARFRLRGVYETNIAARQEIWRIMEQENPDLKLYLKPVDGDRWYSDPAYQKQVLDGLRGSRRSRKGPSASPTPGAVIPFTPGGSNSLTQGTDPPRALRKVEPDVITGRDFGVRRIEPQVRSVRRGESFDMDENAPKSQPGNGSIATPAPQGKSQTRPVAPSSQPVRRARPDAPTGFPGLNRRTVRPAPPSTSDGRAQQKPRDAKRPSKSKKSQQRQSSPRYYPPFIPQVQGGHG